MGQRTSVYLGDSVQAAVKASGVRSPSASAAASPPEPSTEHRPQ